MKKVRTDLPDTGPPDEFVKLLNDTAEDWMGAFLGPPEAQIAALKVLLDMRDAVYSGDQVARLCLLPVLSQPKEGQSELMLRIIKKKLKEEER